MENELKQSLEEFFEDDNNEKVIFIGSGFSKNLGLPTWEEFAYIHLDILKEANKIDFETYELLKKDNFRTIMSMTKDIIFADNELKEKMFEKYIEIFKIDYTSGNINNRNLNLENVNEDNFDEFTRYKSKQERLERVKKRDEIFNLVYELNLINVTTNYDDILDILAENKNKEFSNVVTGEEEKLQKVFYTEDDFIRINKNPEFINNGNVYHIHGSINEISTMIVSNEDYIKRYWSGENSFKNFIKNIFDNYNVIFLGYSLQELEILNYLFEGENGKLERTEKKRLLLLGCFDYEKSKLQFLNEYYYKNYAIKICPFSISKNGYKSLNDIIKVISNIKSDVEERKKGYKRCLEIIQNEINDSNARNELLEKMKEYKSLQADFFIKILGKYNYLSEISNQGYFCLESANINSILKYLNSLYECKERINRKDINDFYKLILKKYNKDLNIHEFALFIVKYSYDINNFNLNELISHLNYSKFNLELLNVILLNFDKEYMFKFFEENRNLLIELLCESIFNNWYIIYKVKNNSKIIEYLLKQEKKKFLCYYIKLYERLYLENKIEDDLFKIDINQNMLTINSNKGEFEKIEIEFSSLQNIYESLEEMGIENLNKLRNLISDMFSKNSYSSIFDNEYMIRDEKVKLLINISHLERYQRDVVDILFKSKVYYLKKLALYLIVKNSMVDYIIDKVNAKDFDLEYMIRNEQFNGEIKECFKLLNDCQNIDRVNVKNLLSMINPDNFNNYYDTQELKDRWRYKRYRELRKFEEINERFNDLKNEMKCDYQMTPMIGKCEVGIVEMLPQIDIKRANSMTLRDWVEYINNYKKLKCKEDFKEYCIEEDVKILIQCLKNNLNLYMNDIVLLCDIKNYEWLFYIFRQLKELLDSDNNDLNCYYMNIVEFINKYLDKLDNIYDKVEDQQMEKKYLVGEFCEVLIIIIRKMDIINTLCKEKFKIIISKLEKKINNKDDYRIFNDNNSYISFINSIHKKLIEFEIIFSLKIKDTGLENEYIRELILCRKEKSPKEFYMFFGNYIYDFMEIDERIANNLLNDIKENWQIEMFLCGFANLKVINEKQYNLLHSKILYMHTNEIKDKNVVNSIVKYDVLAYLLGYENADLKLIEREYNLNTDIIYSIFNLKENCKKLCKNYNEEEYQKKLVDIWSKILHLKWIEKEDKYIEDTLIVLEDITSINLEIEKNIKKILKYIPGSFSVSNKVCKYLKRVLDKKSIKSIVEIIKCYKSDGFDEEIIQLVSEIKDKFEDEYKEFKNNWLMNNQEESALRTHLMK